MFEVCPDDLCLTTLETRVSYNGKLPGVSTFMNFEYLLHIEVRNILVKELNKINTIVNFSVLVIFSLQFLMKFLF